MSRLTGFVAAVVEEEPERVVGGCGVFKGEWGGRGMVVAAAAVESCVW